MTFGRRKRSTFSEEDFGLGRSSGGSDLEKIRDRVEKKLKFRKLQNSEFGPGRKKLESENISDLVVFRPRPYFNMGAYGRSAGLGPIDSKLRVGPLEGDFWPAKKINFSRGNFRT